MARVNKALNACEIDTWNRFHQPLCAKQKVACVGTAFRKNSPFNFTNILHQCNFPNIIYQNNFKKASHLVRAKKTRRISW